MSKISAQKQKIAEEHGVDLSKLPDIQDLSPESITANVHAINNTNCSNERLGFLIARLVDHLHDFVRETSLTTDEWMAAINFLVETGRLNRPEMIILSDTLGVSSLVDHINNAKPHNATESTVLGPFFHEGASEVKNGESIASEGKGDYLFVQGYVTDTKGKPIPGAIINTWETDGFGLYDDQYPDGQGYECRGFLRSGTDGSYAFRAVVPVGYPIPDDGTVGKLLKKLGRHSFRPAHLHIKLEAPGFETLVTALYLKEDPFINSDAVFGVRTSLIVDPEIITDTAVTLSRGFKEAKPHAYLKQDFILATPEEAEATRAELKAKTLKKH